jgi:CTP:phosphocholine cytidylyltransferase-like protein
MNIIFQLNQLRLECERIQLFEEEYKKKLENYQQVSMAIYTKLDHLWLRGNQFFSTNYCKSLQVHNFVSSVREDWRFADTVIARDVQTIQLVSYTTPSKSLYIQATSQAHRNCNTSLTRLKQKHIVSDTQSTEFQAELLACFLLA